MSTEEIKESVEYLTQEISHLTNRKHSLNQIIYDIEERINVVALHRNKIQNKCSHEFKGKPNMMGKGNCVICGYSDY